MALRLAQELSYLYGFQDLWQNGEVDDERVKSQLILYCGVMFGVSGAVSGVRVLYAQLAKTTLKKLPQKALTKTFWYPIIKQIGKVIGLKITKDTVAKGVSKAIPVIGGVISGGLNFASMMPMASRLHQSLDTASFNYSEEDLKKDIEIIENVSDDIDSEINQDKNSSEVVKSKVAKGIKSVGAGITGMLNKKNNNNKDITSSLSQSDEILRNIEKLSELKNIGAITEDEFSSKKSELLAIL